MRLKLIEVIKKNIEYNRYDIILRYLMIEYYYNKNTYGLDMYKKMQKNRMKLNDEEIIEYIEKFYYLIDNISKNRYNNNFPIVIDKNHLLFDGSHRLSCILYFKLKNVKIELDNRLNFKHTFFNLKWFKENNFTDEEIKIMKNKQIDIFNIWKL